MFTAKFFQANRQKLLKQLQPSSFIVLTANGRMQRTSDMAYDFQQEANFWYLTGIDHPDWLLLIDVDSGREWLIAPKIPEILQIFDGSLALEDAQKISGVSTILNGQEGLTLLKKFVAEKKRAYTLMPPPKKAFGFYTNPARRDLANKLKTIETEDLRLPLAKLRAIKQPLEIAAMKQAINLTVKGFESVQEQLPHLRHEYEVEALFTYEFRRHGADGHAYDPIVAASKNACTLHYGANNNSLTDQRFLLMDVGAAYRHYAADVTRTLWLKPPTDRERAIYEAAHRVHQEAIELLRPGQEVQEYLERVDEAMTRELLHLNLIKKTADMRRYFPHAIGHGLGIDAHDPLGAPKNFEASMVLTVEPGIYVPEESIGVRIEDDILITANGPENLSSSLATTMNM